MDTSSPKPTMKRPSDAESAPGEAPRKRLRTTTPENGREPTETVPSTNPNKVAEAKANTHNDADWARDGLERSIALALQHVGFDSASPEALASLTATTETYMTTFVQHLKRFAESARREHPTAADFGYMLRKHNIPISSLKPHLKNPVAKGKLQPKYCDPSLAAPRTDYFRTTSTEFLGPELDGNADRQNKPWIPEGLPAFPSKHTYKFTPAEAIVAQDPAKKRAEALADSHKGEKALRRINRAAKISQQKELREMAQRSAMSRQRHENWEAMVKAMMPQHGAAPGARQELADHSVIVDSSARYKRREVPRASNRAPLDTISSKV